MLGIDGGQASAGTAPISQRAAEPVFCRGHGVGDSRYLGMSVVRWFVSSRRESDVSGYRSDHLRRVWERGQMVAGCSFGPAAPLAFLTDVTLYLEIGDVLENRNTKDCDWRDQELH